MQEQNSPNQTYGGFKSKLAADKLIGYALLTVGLLMIVIPVIMAISVLTGRSKPTQVLSVEPPSIQFPSLDSSIKIPDQLKEQGFLLGQGGTQGASQKIIPDEVFNFYINASVFYLLMMFIASAGSKIAIIGTHLIKEMKVKS